MHSTPLQQRIHLPGIGAVAYARAGSGPPVLLLHGLGGDYAVWGMNLPALASAYTVYAPDLPGHGGSARTRAPYTLDFGVGFTIAFLDTLGLERVTLVGSSMGGLVALAAAIRYPERTHALALASPAGLGRELPRAMRLASIPIVGPLLAFLDMRLGPGLLPTLFHQPHLINPAMLQEIHRMASVPGVQRAAISILRQGVNLGGLRPDLVQLDGLHGFNRPVLVVWGQQDAVIPVSHAYRARAASPTAGVHILPGCGHLPQIEKAQEFNRLLLDFLEGVYGHGGSSRQETLAREEHPT
ncbi:MAG: alpha/beta fold hydrolase [Chloroflexi bacterium]|nr:alpha/beta fold hydrolase [Chloroflexota bacterium]